MQETISNWDIHVTNYDYLESEHVFGWTDSDRIKVLDENLWHYREPKHAFQSRVMLVDVAVNRFEEGLVSLGRAAEIARLPYDKMIDALQSRGIPIRFGPESVNEAETERTELLEQFRQSKRRR